MVLWSGLKFDDMETWEFKNLVSDKNFPIFFFYFAFHWIFFGFFIKLKLTLVCYFFAFLNFQNLFQSHVFVSLSACDLFACFCDVIYISSRTIVLDLYCYIVVSNKMYRCNVLSSLTKKTYVYFWYCVQFSFCLIVINL